jgi:DNA-directed RNA polymerase subunit alpha
MTNDAKTAVTSKPEFNLAGFMKKPDLVLDDLLEMPRYIFASDKNRTELEVILKEWSKIENEFSRKADGNIKKAFALMLLKEEDEAYELLKTSKSIPEAYFVLGIFHRRRNEYEEMAEVASDGLERFPELHALSLLLVEAHICARDLESAKEARDELPEEVEGSAEHAYLEGLMAELEGDYELAVSKYDAAILRNPKHVRALFRLAYLCDRRGEDERAIDLYERIRIVLPCHIGAMMNLGTLYEDALNWDDALECFEAVIAQEPNNERARMFKSDVLASRESIVYEEDEKKKDQRQAILKIPVTDFELSVRSRNCLNKMGIRSLGDLIKRSEQELLAYKNFGETSLNEIREMLAAKGLSLGQPLGQAKEGASEDAQSELLSRSIDTLQLSVRARKCMDRLGIRTLEQLIQKSETELLGERNFGQTSLDEVNKQLKPMGLTLASSKQ